jgi:hypothetical protein
MGRSIVPQLEAIRCTCEDCKCKPRVQQLRPNTDLNKSHLLQNKDHIPFDTTNRSNFKKNGIAPIPVYLKPNHGSTLTFGDVNFIRIVN